MSNHITKKWVVDMVQWMKEKKQDIASCIMITANGQYILLENGSMYEIKPVNLPFEMPTHECKGKSGDGGYTLIPGYVKPGKLIPIKSDLMEKFKNRRVIFNYKKDKRWFE